ncbi:hypothetical protein BpHYR1_013691 [Brachionus plicatilis]|uniref:Uncharacterized protein n=1 Tax=Brachionus plicatilis TaxID=10195 RepID=A0A3M7RU38_BRAPC|nr:hypothetical protein BpHYR1_013691 [Brachionus plicatilis]
MNDFHIGVFKKKNNCSIKYKLEFNHQAIENFKKAQRSFFSILFLPSKSNPNPCPVSMALFDKKKILTFLLVKNDNLIANVTWTLVKLNQISRFQTCQKYFKYDGRVDKFPVKT